jgi:hypothetical protein
VIWAPREGVEAALAVASQLVAVEVAALEAKCEELAVAAAAAGVAVEETALALGPEAAGEVEDS